MPECANKALVRRYYEEVVSTGDVSRMEQFVSDDYVEVHDNARHQLGLQGAKSHVLGVRRTYPDLELTVEQQIAEGEWVVSRVTARGTHQGVRLDMTPTGKRLEMTAVNVDRVVDGRIVEHGGAANLLEPLLKIGAIKVAYPMSENSRERPGVARRVCVKNHVLEPRSAAMFHSRVVLRMLDFEESTKTGCRCEEGISIERRPS